MSGASAALFICSKLEAKPPTWCERIWSRLRIYTLLNTGFSHPRKPRWVQEEALCFKKHSTLMCIKKKKNRPLLVQINMDSTCHVEKKHYSPWLVFLWWITDSLLTSHLHQGWNRKVGLWPSRWSSPSQGHLHNVAGELSDIQTADLICDSCTLDCWFVPLIKHACFLM